MVPKGRIIQGHRCYNVDEYKEIAKVIIDHSFAKDQIYLMRLVIQEQEQQLEIKQSKINLLVGTVEDMLVEWKANEANWELKLKAANSRGKSSKLWKTVSIISGAVIVGLGGALWVTK